MTTFNLPTGGTAEMCETAAIKAWAMYFAHARCGMGLELRVEQKSDLGLPAIRVESVGASQYRATRLLISPETGEVLLDYGEQCAMPLLDPLAAESLNADWLGIAQQMGDEMALAAQAWWREEDV
jgi:hypothetical protein